MGLASVSNLDAANEVEVVVDGVLKHLWYTILLEVVRELLPHEALLILESTHCTSQPVTKPFAAHIFRDGHVPCEKKMRPIVNGLDSTGIRG